MIQADELSVGRAVLAALHGDPEQVVEVEYQPDDQSIVVIGVDNGIIYEIGVVVTNEEAQLAEAS